MKKIKLLTLGLMAAALCLSCTACTSLAENTETYFSSVSSILSNLMASGKTPPDPANRRSCQHRHPPGRPHQLHHRR